MKTHSKFEDVDIISTLRKIMLPDEPDALLVPEQEQEHENGMEV